MKTKQEHDPVLSQFSHAGVGNRVRNRQKRISALHPQANGAVERLNRTIGQMLKKTQEENDLDWDLKIPFVRFNYLNQEHSSTGYSPFYLTFGRNPRTPVLVKDSSMPKPKTPQQWAIDLAKTLKEAHDVSSTRDRLQKEKRTEKSKEVLTTQRFKVGDEVLVYSPTRKGQVKSLHRAWAGPYIVIQCREGNTYRIKNSDNFRQRFIRHHDQLRYLHSRPLHLTKLSQADVTDDKPVHDTQPSGVPKKPTTSTNTVPPSTSLPIFGDSDDESDEDSDNGEGAKHRASDCRSKYKCQKCESKHHTSICDKEPTPQRMMLATGEGTVIYPVVVVLVEGIKCRALLDTGAGSSYASAALLQHINKRPVRTEHKRIDMMMCSTTQRIDVYDLTVKSVDGKFELATTGNKVDKGVLLTVPNPSYAEKIKKYRHLDGVVMEDNDPKSELPIHMIFGARLEDKPEGNQQIVYDEFIEQLDQTEDGWYETGLLWKPGHKTLPTNERGSIKRLESLLKKLQSKPELFDKYDEIIQEQLDEGIVERVEEDPKEREFYIPPQTCCT
ncbi:hypothetical protein QZH41_011251 [Actinostola sp. cb2023]|nr:hypothetical protein QZH41_011251 [Actinostola sp. cb2023]